MTDSLKASTENMADAFGGNVMTLRWADIYSPEETRTANEIISNIRNKIKEGEDESI